VLLDDKATARAIDGALRDFLSKAKEEDTVVIFLAGHGAQDDHQELKLLTYESDFAKPETWYSLDGIRGFLSNRPLLQKAVLIMDICHAGVGIPPSAQGLRRNVTSEQAAGDMTRETGSLYFAAARGWQSALEGEQFGGGHGAFTATLLEALSGKGDTDKDGSLGSHELARFVADRVVSLTEGYQIPVSNYAGTYDFTLFRLR
jgi:uncharacterized caspase-like protein